MGIPPAVGFAAPTPPPSFTDLDADGVEDLLQDFARGRVAFDALREAATAAGDAHRLQAASAGRDAPAVSPASGAAALGQLRVLVLGASPAGVAAAADKAALGGACRVLQSFTGFGGGGVLAVDAAGLRALLADPPGRRLLLDREGVPALDVSRGLVGVPQVTTGAWALGDDWSSSIAILDSGCDTAHGDLGDDEDDDVDGPPPAVGDAADWYPSDAGWPLFQGFKVVGWHDVTDDFPDAAGPWDYHHHGTALASVAAGAGRVDPDLRGVAPAARLTVVKFYDFDGVWRAWAGDFLAACDWLLAHRDVHRVGPVVLAVNWNDDLGIGDAMAALRSAGMTPVAAAGNDGLDEGAPGWPASSPDVLTVGAVNDAGALAAYSTRGASGGAKPDLLAPGGGLSPEAGRITCADNEPDDSYSGRVGTSLAAAHVAGLVHLLDEALAENGVALPRDAAAVGLRAGLLKLTAAPVTAAETADGAGTVSLGDHLRFDAERGFGVARIDAAVRAALQPLLPGQDQADTLTADWTRPVAARRLNLQAGVRYLIEIVPGVGLDAMLTVGDPRRLAGDPRGESVVRENSHGPGVSEFIYFTAPDDGWFLMAVHRVAGAGQVLLRLHEADTFPVQAGAAVLPGQLTGAPNVGRFGSYAGPSFVVPSRVAVDQVARSVQVLDVEGRVRPGWPSYVFPPASAQGGLLQPLVWDLDGAAGDEIVLASDFGMVYFFDQAGEDVTVEVALNRPLTLPVGVETAGGQRRVVVLDRLGTAHAWSAGGVPQATRALGVIQPLSPAAGVLDGVHEAVVVSFADGTITALDPDLQALPGWPVSLGAALTVPPILCDLDDDGAHEVVQAVHDAGTGQVVLRILRGDGSAFTADGAVVPSPLGGSWVDIGTPVVAGRYGDGDLHVAVSGVASNGLGGASARWSLGLGKAFFDGGVASEILPGFQIGATTSEGVLELDTVLLPAPLAWNYAGAWGTETAQLAHLRWNEVLYGLTSLPGAATAWFTTGSPAQPLAARQALVVGGAPAPPLGAAGGALAVLDDDVLVRLEVLDRRVGVEPLRTRFGLAPMWCAERADGRNSGAYPLRSDVSAAPPAPTGPATLRVHPNPGAGRFSFRLAGGDRAAVVDVYDLRGRRVQQLRLPASGTATWDGRDREGRRLPAGTYLARVTGAGVPAAVRVTITR